MNSKFLYAASGHELESPSVAQLCTSLAPVGEGSTCLEVLNRFLADESLIALPVVNKEYVPAVLIQRQRFVEFFTRPYVRELYGRMEVLAFIQGEKYPFVNSRPIIVDESTRIDDVAQMIISAGMENMVTGFIVTRDGRYQGMANGHGLLNEITQRKQADLYYVAHFDHLTGIPNRLLLSDRLAHACLNSARNSTRVGLLFIDLDRFKAINDSFGNGVGDKLLIQVAGRLGECLRGDDTLGRIGGDEFAVVVAHLARPEDVSPVAQKILTALEAPFNLDDHETQITASIGITLYPDDAMDPLELFKNADTAMYRAKEIGRNNYQFYLPEMNERLAERRQLERSLRQALERQEFVLYYQPKAELSGGTLCALEALLRWQHPERGLVSPADFVPALEDTGLIVPVGEWVLQTVCAQIKAWQAQGITPLPVAINMSARQFKQKTLESFIALIGEAGIDPALIKLELTESLLMKDAEETLRSLDRLKATGVSLSVDDFGTGYSSLAYLKRFPLDEIKIDRTFIRDITSDGGDAEIALAVISLAHSLNLKVVAEGVETEAQCRFLRAQGCDEMQGYYFAKPLNIEDCTRVLRERPHLRTPVIEDAPEDLASI